MTTVTIQSDSDKKTLLLMQLAEELGLHAEASDIRELTAAEMATGIGRPATHDELMHYLKKGSDDEAIDIDTAFAKYDADK